MKLLLWCLLIALLVLVSAPATPAAPVIGTLSPFIEKEECNPSLPTTQEAEARLRALGIPEQASASHAQNVDVEDPDRLPEVPEGLIVVDEDLQATLVSTLRRFLACQYVDVVMTIFDFSSDQTLREQVVSIADFREAESLARSNSQNKESHKLALWEVFGIRQVNSETFGIFAVEGKSLASSSQSGWVDLAKFYVFSRHDGQFFLENYSIVGEICEYGDSAFSPDPGQIPPGATPVSSYICSWRSFHR